MRGTDDDLKMVARPVSESMAHMGAFVQGAPKYLRQTFLQSPVVPQVKRRDPTPPMPGGSWNCQALPGIAAAHTLGAHLGAAGASQKGLHPCRTPGTESLPRRKP